MRCNEYQMYVLALQECNHALMIPPCNLVPVDGLILPGTGAFEQGVSN